MGNRAAAFFDVDETVIRTKSMFAFLRFWMAANGDSGDAYEKTMAEIRELAGKVDRSEVNRAYYRLFAGISLDELTRAGQEWYAAYRVTPDAFVPAVTAELSRHRAQGSTIALVSGSFRPVLGPLAEEYGADPLLCTEPVTDAAGRLTGEVVRPMIGPAKGEAVAAAIASLGLAAADCHAYGDHLSDLGMLRQVGHPHVVAGGDPALLAHAREHGWTVLPDGPAARPATHSVPH
ncbi:MmfP [Streptomyces xiamenensis]|uniref:MmfP n=1 Tax=Streptomyces xiamenensis TaxID=408015 RepID=A0A0F7FW91_9ACTN|nr:HAD-IB family hydrolase [Streptomyces xiamenensis]AKG44200.1 MmfP [Streptomyces xiamenensis]